MTIANRSVVLHLLLLAIVTVGAKQILRQSTTFRVDQPISGGIERGRRQSERINLSYPGMRCRRCM